MSSNRKGKQRKDEGSSQPLSPSQEVSRPRTRSQNNTPRQGQVPQSPQLGGPQQQASRQHGFAASAERDANGQTAAESEHWARATGFVMSMSQGGEYAKYYCPAQQDANRATASQGLQVGLPTGSPAGRRPSGRAPSAFDNPALNAPTQALPSGELQQRRAMALAQLQAQRQQHLENFTRMSNQSPNRMPPSMIGRPSDPQSTANLQRLINAGFSLSGGFGTPPTRPGDSGGSGLGFGGGNLGSPFQSFNSQEQHRPQDFAIPNGVPEKEALKMAELFGKDPRLALLTSQAQVTPRSPVPAPRPRTAVLQHILEAPPASPSQGAHNMKDQQGEPTVGGVPGHRREDTQLPQMDLANPKLPTPAVAAVYMNKVFWRPFPRDHGVPTTDQDRLPYVKRIYDAMVDLDHVLDLTTEQTDAKRFWAKSGMWGTEPGCIEAIAHQVVSICVSIHMRGATGFALGRQMEQLCQEDKMFTFAQRIYFMSVLLRGFKFAANLVMLSTMTQEYLARIWSTLKSRLEFTKWWNALSVKARHAHMIVEPYIDVPAHHPTAAEQAIMVNQHRYEDAQRMALIRQHQEQTMQQHRQLAAQQQPQLQLQQSQAKDTPKRPVDTVEEAEAGPSSKRRAAEALSASAVLDTETQDPQTQEESTEGEASGTQPLATNNMQDQSFEDFLNEEAYNNLFAPDVTNDREPEDEEEEFGDLFGSPKEDRGDEHAEGEHAEGEDDVSEPEAE
ncbi:hypothetical protein CC86DRAFT_385399 [Ophiobolus disseminans]|uniref:Uncharacterized protein n=1 Tax=Ophiobolus disseminans TaxID=1469910 RepID=A0A6A6ZQ56_9PLEO|nr:hypothetical protein CC86DRAFT_385399 [Ophiobolus disseminans]